MPEIAIQTADGAKERFPLVKNRVTIGRSRESDIFLPDQWLSRHHAEILQRNDGYYVLVPPLPPGPHTIVFGGTITDPDFTFTLHVTYTITVA